MSSSSFRRLAPVLLLSAALLSASCQDGDTPSGPTPVTPPETPVVEPVRSLVAIDWSCEGDAALVGDSLYCRADGTYDADPEQEDITRHLLPADVVSSDAAVLVPVGVDPAEPDSLFELRALAPGTASARVVFDGVESAAWSVTVEAPEPVDLFRWRGIRVEPERPDDGTYDRPSWAVADTAIWAQDGRPPCTPYSRTPIGRVGAGDGLDREHIVALKEAWDSRPDGFSRADLRRVAEDHDNLTLVLAAVNRSKGDRDAAEWEPRYNAAWMANRVVEVKREYDLSVNPSERDALERMLGSGPDTIICE